MIFSNLFELGLFILGLLYVGNMYFDSCVHLMEVMNDINDDEKDKQHDEELKQLTQHIYS